jgi:hypothetical protein
MNTQAMDQTGRQVHAPTRRSTRRRDDLEPDLALEDPSPRMVSTTWHWRHGLDSSQTFGTTS